MKIGRKEENSNQPIRFVHDLGEEYGNKEGIVINLLA